MRILEAVNRWLPPPELLRVSGVGVDISESSIKYIGFKPSYRGLFALALSVYGEVPLGNGVLSKGEVVDVAALGEALAMIRAKTKNPYMHIALPEERAYVFETEIDRSLTPSEIRQQIEFRLEENVPLSPRDAYFDFNIAPGEGKSDRAAVTVCPKELVDSYYEACRRAKVTPISFEVESAAIARSALPGDDRGTRVLLDFGKTRTGLGIVHDGQLLYTSTIDLGGDSLSASLRAHLGERPEDALTAIKNETGLVRTVDNNAAFEALLPVVSAIKDEVQRRIQYWNDKNGATLPIDQVIVCGGSANLRGLVPYLSETLGVEASLADVWQNAFDTKLLTPPIDRRHSYGYATAIGLGLASYFRNL